jgi:hypothetical protein
MKCPRGKFIGEGCAFTNADLPRRQCRRPNDALIHSGLEFSLLLRFTHAQFQNLYSTTTFLQRSYANAAHHSNYLLFPAPTPPLQPTSQPAFAPTNPHSPKSSSPSPICAHSTLAASHPTLPSIAPSLYPFPSPSIIYEFPTRYISSIPARRRSYQRPRLSSMPSHISKSGLTV